MNLNEMTSIIMKNFYYFPCNKGLVDCWVITVLEKAMTETTFISMHYYSLPNVTFYICFEGLPSKSQTLNKECMTFCINGFQ